MRVLARYDAARSSLAEAHRVDEVKDIRDKAVAMQIYARQAKDSAMIEWATDIRLRAERKAGQLLAEMAQSGARETKGGDRKSKSHDETLIDKPATLADLGVTKTQSHRWQKLGGLDDAAFEARAAAAKTQALAAVETPAAERTAEKQERRAQREAELGAKQQALPQQRFGVILADPEWRFEPWSRASGLDRSPDNHYPTSALEVIAARDVPSIAADDCVLFLWATAPMLPHALIVMGAWGFDYKTHIVWAKDRTGTGYWFRNRHELLLVGARGDVPGPAMGTQSDSLIEAPRGEHSAKPDAFLEMIEAYFPTLPKIELNRRGPAREGWAAWGNEVEPEVCAAPHPAGIRQPPSPASREKDEGRRLRCSADYLAAVERALPDAGEGATPRGLHAAIGIGARSTVVQALGELSRLGRARFEGEPMQRRYWRVESLEGR